MGRARSCSSRFCSIGAGRVAARYARVDSTVGGNRFLVPSTGSVHRGAVRVEHRCHGRTDVKGDVAQKAGGDISMNWYRYTTWQDSGEIA